jgi:hypothetical protein
MSVQSLHHEPPDGSEPRPGSVGPPAGREAAGVERASQLRAARRRAERRHAYVVAQWLRRLEDRAAR